MGAQLNIKDSETIPLARELAEMTGRAIRIALERELKELDHAKEERLTKLRGIVKEARALWKPEFLNADLHDLMYDKHGLPQ